MTTRPAVALSGETYWKDYFERRRREREEASDRTRHHRQISDEMDRVSNGGASLRVGGAT